MFSDRAMQPTTFDPVPLRVAAEAELVGARFFNGDFDQHYAQVAAQIPDWITSVAARFDHGNWLIPLSHKPDILSLRRHGHILTEREILDHGLASWHWRAASPLVKTIQYLQHHFAHDSARGAIFRRDGLVGLYYADGKPLGLLLPLPASGHDILLATQGIAEDFPGYFEIAS